MTYILGLLCLGCGDDAEDSAADAGLVPDQGADAAPDAAPDAARDAAPDAALDAAPDVAPDAAPEPIGGEDRPALVYPPAGEPPAAGWPILVLLHGFGAAPATVDRNFNFSRRVDQDGWIVVVPPALPNEEGSLRWTSDFHAEGRGPDVDYLTQVIDQVVERHQGDPARVTMMGHSNGGAMAQHFACYAADRVQLYINVSGFNAPPAQCTPSQPVAAMFIHGTTDDAVPYEGRDERPGAEAAAADWAQRLNCADPVESGPFDYDLRADDETTVRHWGDCDAAAVTLWRMEDIGHVIVPNAAFLDAIVSRALTD